MNVKTIVGIGVIIVLLVILVMELSKKFSANSVNDTQLPHISNASLTSSNQNIQRSTMFNPNANNNNAIKAIHKNHTPSINIKDIGSKVSSFFSGLFLVAFVAIGLVFVVLIMINQPAPNQVKKNTPDQEYSSQPTTTDTTKELLKSDDPKVTNADFGKRDVANPSKSSKSEANQLIKLASEGTYSVKQSNGTVSLMMNYKSHKVILANKANNGTSTTQDFTYKNANLGKYGGVILSGINKNNANVGSSAIMVFNRNNNQMEFNPDVTNTVMHQGNASDVKESQANLLASSHLIDPTNSTNLVMTYHNSH